MTMNRMMFKRALARLCLLTGLLLPGARADAQDATPPPAVIPIARVTSPIKGQDARGTVVIEGAAVAPGFTRYEIAFASEPDVASWTIIGGNNRQVPIGSLLAWNTRPISDGGYALRLQVFTNEGVVNEVIVRDIKLVNQAAGAARGADTTAADSPAGAARNVEVDGTRNLLRQITAAAERVPLAFSRGVRLVAYALGGLIAYTLLKMLAAWLWARYGRGKIDYGK